MYLNPWLFASVCVLHRLWAVGARWRDKPVLVEVATTLMKSSKPTGFVMNVFTPGRNCATSSSLFDVVRMMTGILLSPGSALSFPAPRDRLLSGGSDQEDQARQLGLTGGVTIKGCQVPPVVSCNHQIVLHVPLLEARIIISHREDYPQQKNSNNRNLASIACLPDLTVIARHPGQ